MAKTLGRFRCTDQMGLRPVPVRDRRGRDQDPDEEEEQGGRLVCRIVEDRAGNMHVMDAGRLRLRARRSKDGTLEIRHHEDEPDEEQTSDEAAAAPSENGDPREQVTGSYPGGAGGDPARATATTPTGDAMARFQRTQRPEHHIPALAEYQRKLDRHYNNGR